MAELSLPRVTDGRDVERFVLDLDRRLERLDRAILVADWNQQIGRSTEGSSAIQLRRSAMLSEARLLSWVRAAVRRPLPMPIARRLGLLERVLLETQVEQHPSVVRLRSRLQRRLVAFRPRWNGKRANRSAIYRVFREDPVAAHRRRAYYVLDPLYRPMEEEVRELIRIRNERARAVGFRTFADLRLGFEGFTPARIEELAEAASAWAGPTIRGLRDRPDPPRARTGWYPWDFFYVRAQLNSLPERSFPRSTMLPTILRAVRAWGFPTERMRFKVVFHDLPAGGLTLAPDPPRDVRILVHPQGGWPAYQVMFHEVGHAVHSASIRAPRHLLRWHENVPGFGGFHEGIGGLFESVASSPAWLASQPGVTRSEADRIAVARRDTEVASVAQTVEWIRIEQALYRDPDRDPMPDALRRERRLFGYDEHPGRSFVDSFWIEAPSYAPNYLLATLFHHQIARSLRERFGDPLWPNRRVGPWLTREWFAPGSIYDWVPRVRELTGRPFGARAYRDAMRTDAA